MEELVCKYCNCELDCEDVLDKEGGILEGYIREYQSWYCPKCYKGYRVDVTVYFNKDDNEISIEEDED